MSAILSFLLSYVLLYKYLALFFIVFSASIIVPFPVTEIMIAVGAFVNQGYFNPWMSFVVAQAANVLGDLIDYLITRRYGYAPLHKLRLSRSRLFKKVEEELKAHARSTIFVTRFAGGLGPLVNFLSGAAGISFKKFLTFDFLGNFVYFVGALSLGYWAGGYWENLSDFLGLAIGTLSVLVVFSILWRVYQAIRNRHSHAHLAPQDAESDSEAEF